MSAKPTEQPPSPPSASLLKRLEDATTDAAVKLLGMPEKPKSQRYLRLTDEQETKLREVERVAIADFRGDLTQLEAALGMLRLGPQFGWKVLYVIHSKKTIRTYEDILKHRIRDLFPEEGPSSYRSFGLALAKRFSNFWKVAGGDIKIPKRREVAE